MKRRERRKYGKVGTCFVVLFVIHFLRYDIRAAPSPLAGLLHGLTGGAAKKAYNKVSGQGTPRIVRSLGNLLGRGDYLDFVKNIRSGVREWKRRISIFAN